MDLQSYAEIRKPTIMVVEARESFVLSLLGHDAWSIDFRELHILLNVVDP